MSTRGYLLYQRYAREHAKRGIEVDDWADLDDTEREVWEAVAEPEGE